MELPLEAYNLIVQYIGSRAVLASLCTVSKRFQYAAERALYNTLHLRGCHHTTLLCDILARTPRLAILVVALSIFAQDEEDSDEEQSSLPDDYWQSVARALRRLTRLRFLNLYLNNGGQTAKAWILDGCTFQLRNFHCDLAWDEHLSSFLSSQSRLNDLYLSDFQEVIPSSTPPSILNADSLPALSILECTFTEAAIALIPGRPVTRLKTCFSRTQVAEKREEMRALISSLRLSKKGFRALDIADSSYTQDSSLEILISIVNTTSSANDLCYLGTLVLPIDGRKRLEFYGLLMRLSRLRCIEVEVTDWDPAPTNRAALRALTCELRLYCPSVTRVVFVYDFDRFMINVVDDLCVFDEDAVTDTLWREV